MIVYLIFIFKSIYARPPFPSPSTTTLAYVIKEIRERRAREGETRESKNTQKKAQAIYYYLDLLYVLKGFLDWSIAHPTFYHTKLTYQGMLISFFNFIYLSINIIPTLIVNPYTMQITLHIKVFFKS